MSLTPHDPYMKSKVSIAINNCQVWNVLLTTGSHATKEYDCTILQRGGGFCMSSPLTSKFFETKYRCAIMKSRVTHVCWWYCPSIQLPSLFFKWMGLNCLTFIHCNLEPHLQTWLLVRGLLEELSMINRILSMEVAPSKMSISYINDLNIGDTNSMVTFIQLNGPKRRKEMLIDYQ
jgi:hypothetical protein